MPKGSLIKYKKLLDNGEESAWGYSYGHLITPYSAGMGIDIKNNKTGEITKTFKTFKEAVKYIGDRFIEIKKYNPSHTLPPLKGHSKIHRRKAK